MTTTSEDKIARQYAENKYESTCSVSDLDAYPFIHQASNDSLWGIAKGKELERNIIESVIISSEEGYPDDETNDYKIGYDICLKTIRRLLQQKIGKLE